MSVISSIAELFRLANAVPSIESSAARGLGYNSIVENLRARLPADAIVSPTVLGQAIGRVQRAQSIGADINAGRSVDPRLYSVDTTLPSGTNYRYRVAITIEVPPQFPGDTQRPLRTVVPVDSDIPLSRAEIISRVAPVVRLLGRETDSPSYREARTAIDYPNASVSDITVISAYRQSLR